MKNKQKAPIFNPTTITVPLAKLSEDELDIVSGGQDKFIYYGTGHCRFCFSDNQDY